MKSFAKILATVFLATYTSHIALAAPITAPGSVHYLHKRNAMSASTWRSEEDPHAFMNARNIIQNMQRQVVNDAGSTLAATGGPSATADIAQTVENTTGTDKSQASAGPIAADTSSVPSMAGKAPNLNAAQSGPISPVPIVGENAISLPNDASNTSETASISSDQTNRKRSGLIGTTIAPMTFGDSLQAFRNKVFDLV